MGRCVNYGGESRYHVELTVASGVSVPVATYNYDAHLRLPSLLSTEGAAVSGLHLPSHVVSPTRPCIEFRAATASCSVGS